MQISPAKAGLKEHDFFDFTYAQWVWNNLKTREQFDAEWDKIDAVLEEHEALRKTNRKKSNTLLYSDTEKGAMIRKGYDLYNVFRVWGEGLQFYDIRKPWNEENCRSGLRKTINIFTYSCNDWPDWRSKKRLAAEEETRKKLEEGRKEQQQFADELREFVNKHKRNH